jgi:hypothetical protein
VAAISRDLESRVAAFGEAFPDATARHPILSSLLTFTECRMHLVEQAAAARAKAAALAVDGAVIEPTVEVAGAAERRLGLVPVSEFATRM